MADHLLYPLIEPTTFDVIVVGTGLPESVIASAASTAGKSVLHVDPNPFYGGHFASLPLHDLISFLHSQSQPQPQPQPSSANSDGSDDFATVSLTTRPVYSDVEISSHSTEPLEQSRKFNIDLAGPRVLFCADSVVDLMLNSGASQYMEFKSIDASFVCDGDGKLWNVPDSRKAIFKDRTLGLTEKNRLMRFYKVVQEHLQAVNSSGDPGRSNEGERITEEDLESPFVEFLNKMDLSPKIKSTVLYAIAMADYDQGSAEVSKDLLKTKEGIKRLGLYHSSVGRFSNALGALIYPIYGQGELPQAFCRRAAVKSCIHVLRMPVIALLMDKDNGIYKGIKLASGQELFSHHLVLDPSFTVPSSLPNYPSDFLENSSCIFGLGDFKGKVTRGICITNRSLRADLSNCLVVYPPRCLYPDQVTSIRVLQISSNVAVTPAGMFVFYLSALCNDSVQGKKSLLGAINALFSVSVSRETGNTSMDANESENKEESKPTLLWSALYTQDLTTDALDSITSTSMPDGNLHYNDMLDATRELYNQMYPEEPFFPETSSDDKLEDDGE